MYIKRISVCGFRTYRNETVFDFTRGINCIVGFNGSGKSNILKALEFVLSDAIEWGRMYLHEGVGEDIKRGYVEVIFDRINDKCSGMFDKDTIAIRKIVEDDKYLILVNGKAITKEHYGEMLESYGICVNNLYNIIKQGEIVKISYMEDQTILLHLKNILGAKKFEEKKEDAMRMLTSYDCKMYKTEKEFDELSHRIDQLKKDNQRYKMYEKLETERKQLEYNLTKLRLQQLIKDSEKAKKKIAILNEQAETADMELCNYIDKKTDLMEEINKLKLEIASSENALNVQMSEEIQNERNIVHMQILLEEKKEEKQKAINEDKQRFAERQQINEYISVVNEKITLFRRAIAAKEATMKSKKDEIDQMLATNKKRENTNKEEYAANIKKLEVMLKDMDVEIEGVEYEILKTLQLLERLEEVYNSLLEESRRNATLSGKCDDRIKVLNQQAEEYVEKKRQKQQEIASLTTRLNTVKGQRMEAKEKYEDMLKSSQKEIKKLLEMLWEEPSINNENVYGLLIDNVKVDKKYVTAVDAILEHHYFVLIVRDAHTAKTVINFIDKKREERPTDKEDDVVKPAYCRSFVFGRIVIVPMDRIKIYNRHPYPEDEDIVPLINCIEYDEKISNYMKQILYKTILVKSLDSCESYYTEKYTCVDLDGDYISSMGYISGGYTKRKHSMYAMNAKVKGLKEEEESIKKQIEECYNCIEKLDDEIRENYDKRSIVLAQKNGCDTRLGSLENTGKSNEEYIRVTDMKLTGLKAKKKGLEDYKKKIKDQISALKEECDNINKGKNQMKEGKGEENHDKNKNEEEDHLNILTDEVKKLKDEILHIQHKQDEYKNKLELLYNKKLESDSYIYFSDAGDTDIKEYEKRLQEKEELREVIIEKKKSIEKHIEQIIIEKNKLKQEVEKILVAEKKQKKRILDLCHQINHLNSEIRIFDMKESELKDKKSNLEQGTKDENSMQHKHLNVAQLSARLKAVTSQLKQYMNVNAKIGLKLHQLVTDYTNLKTRKADLKESYQGIMHMIVNIEKRKNDLLEYNFEKINKYFSEIFSTLFNNKTAHLVLNKMTEEEYLFALEKEHSKKKKKEFDDDAPYVDKVTGISVKIFSTGEETRLCTVQELSGGERSIVVLCLLLALNKIDNCSFFFFDEVDAALDTVHRTNLAILLKELASQGTQFIINTFRKELLEYCDNLYIVKSVNRESLVDKGTKEQAYDIITLEEKRVAVQ